MALLNFMDDEKSGKNTCNLIWRSTTGTLTSCFGLMTDSAVVDSTGARCVRKIKKNKILYNTTRGRTHLLPFV
jgi:hypothetical protein